MSRSNQFNPFSLLALCVGGVAAVGALETAYFYNRTMKRNRVNTERTARMAGTDWSQYDALMTECREYMLSCRHEDVWQESVDGLRLHGVFFPPNQNLAGKKRVVLALHGYTSKSMQDFIGLSAFYLKRGYGMLQPDARAHGESEGEYIGFGCLDRKDVLVWLDWLIRACGEEVEILLHGISMGGATALMASSLKLPPQVKGIISDCGFTSPKEVFTHVLNTMYHLPAFPVIPMADMVNKRLAGYGMDECNAKREVASAKAPVLLIHGTADTFVPTRMCREIYDACRAPKRMLLVEGAAHAESYFKDSPAYEKAVMEFEEEVLSMDLQAGGALAPGRKGIRQPGGHERKSGVGHGATGLP